MAKQQMVYIVYDDEHEEIVTVCNTQKEALKIACDGTHYKYRILILSRDDWKAIKKVMEDLKQ